MKTLITIIRSVVALAGVAGRNFLSVQFIKTNFNLLQTRIYCAVALGIGSSFGLAAATEDSADTAPATTAIPWSQLGAKAGADYQGDALAVVATAKGARLSCAFQRLEGEATREGLWLTSTVIPPGGTENDRFRFLAVEVGRGTPCAPSAVGGATDRSANVQPSASGIQFLATGTVSIDGQSVRIDPTFSDANWSSMGGVAGAIGVVSAAVVDGSGNLYIGGSFNVAGEVIANHVAKWNGSSWSVLGSGVDGGDYPYVSALAVSGSNLYVGGNFTTAGGSAVKHIAKWDGSNWSALGSGMNSEVRALAVSGSDLYAGGGFTTEGGSTANYIAQWNGSSWSALGTGMNYDVYALAVSGSDLYAGGYFNTAGGTPASNIAKWNGSNWSALGSGMIGYGWVSAVVVSGSDLFAGGSFIRTDDSAASHLAKWNGSTWSALGSGIGGDYPHVHALAMSGSDLYAAGWFSTEGGISAGRIAKWDGSAWTVLSSGIGGVAALVVSDSDLYAGGGFSTAGGKVSAYVARAYLHPLPTLSVLRSGENVTLSWPADDTAGFVLEQADSLADPASWVTISATVTDDGINKSVTVPVANRSQFFRLRRP